MPSSSGISACWPPTNWRMVRLMRCGALSSKNTGLPSFHSDMCMWPPQPGQSFDHLAMKVASQSRFCASTLVKSLNSAALSAASKPVRNAQRSLEHASAGLGVQALDAHVHGLAHGEQVLVPVAQHGVAQHRIAEEAGRDRLQVPVALLADREGRLGEDEELVLEADLDLEAHLLRPRQHAAQHAARTELLGRSGELAEEHQVAAARSRSRGRSRARCARWRRDRRCASRCR